MAKSTKRPLVIFNFKQFRRIGDFIIRVKAIVAAIEANTTLFATPSPSTASVKSHITALETAETRAQTRVVGSVATRDEKYSVVMTDVHNLMIYVQGLADKSASAATAVTIIESSGFGVKGKRVHVKPPLKARNAPASGSVKLMAKAAVKRATYQWQMSTNNGSTWQNLTSTLGANTIVTGLTPGTRVLFRVCAITQDGIGNWTTPVALVVI